MGPSIHSHSGPVIFHTERSSCRIRYTPDSFRSPDQNRGFLIRPVCQHLRSGWLPDQLSEEHALKASARACQPVSGWVPAECWLTGPGRSLQRRAPIRRLLYTTAKIYHSEDALPSAPKIWNGQEDLGSLISDVIPAQVDPLDGAAHRQASGEGLACCIRMTPWSANRRLTTAHAPSCSCKDQL